MNRMKLTFPVLLFALLTLASAQMDEPADVTLTINNQGAVAYILESVEGAQGVGEVGAENSAWKLEAGNRYRVVNNGGLLFHPFELRGDEGVLLAQGEPEGSFEGDTEVGFVSDEEGVTFTLTPALAEVLTNYRCTIHPVMTGAVAVGAPQ